MTDPHPLSRVAERGAARGADDVLHAARTEAARPPSRGPILLAAAAVAIVAVFVGSVALWGNGDEPTSLETADPDPETPTTDTTSPETTVVAAPEATVFGFRAVDGIIQITSTGTLGNEQVIGGVRGQEGSTSLAVGPDGTVVYHDMFDTGCRSNVVRTTTDGTSDVLIENAALPAVDNSGAHLAYASGTQCTHDGDFLAVRSLKSGATSTLEVSGDDGLPFRIDDVEWVGDKIAVLGHQYDGQVVAAQWLNLYTVPDDGTPRFDSQLLLGDQGSGTLDDFAFQNVEPAPGAPGVIVRAKSSTDGGSELVVVDLESGDEERLISSPVPITSFSLRSLDDLFYVASESKIPGERGQIDTLHRRFSDADFVVANDIASVAVSPATGDSTPPSEDSTPIQTLTSDAWSPGNVQLLQDGRILADGYNAFVQSEQPSYGTDPVDSALALLGVDAIDADIATQEVDGLVEVTLTFAIPDDDSVSGTRRTLQFVPNSGSLRYSDGTWASRCARGDNTTDFVVGKVCP